MIPILFATESASGLIVWLGLAGCLLTGMFCLGAAAGCECRLPAERLHLRRAMKGGGR